MDNTFHQFVDATGTGINITVQDFYQEHGKGKQYQVQEALYYQPSSKEDFLKSWHIEIPGCQVAEAQPFHEDGDKLWHVTYVCGFEQAIFITIVKYWKHKEPDVFVHAYPY